MFSDNETYSPYGYEYEWIFPQEPAYSAKSGSVYPYKYQEAGFSPWIIGLVGGGLVYWLYKRRSGK